MDRLELISPSGAAKMLHVKRQTLAVWRCAKRHPLNYVKLGRRVLYRREDIERFVKGNVRKGGNR